MSGEIWALLSAAAWAVDSMLVRKGTAFSNASTAAFVSFLVSVLFLVPYIFWQFPSEKIFHSANLYFVASGVIQPAMVRVLFYMGIIRLGVSRAGPLRGTADEPLIASTVSSATSFLCLLVSLGVSGTLGSLKFRGGCLPRPGRAFRLVGQLFTFHALHAGEVSVVSPIINTTPLFIIAFTRYFCAARRRSPGWR